MTITNNQRRLLALCAIRIGQESVDWSLIAREAQFPEGLDALWNGSIRGKSAAAERSLSILKAGIRKPDELFARVDTEVAAAETVGVATVGTPACYTTEW